MTGAILRILLLTVSLYPFAFAQNIEEEKIMSRRIDYQIEKYKAEIIKTRRFIHMNPELSNREFETAKLVASTLMSYGLEVRTGIARTGVVALLRGSQPGFTVGIRADMDALPIQEMTSLTYKSLNPGVMHACGHDIHTAVAIGTAMVMSQLKDQIKGNIKFIFQPAEEGPPPGEAGGAALMLEQGILDNPPVGAVFGLHTWPEADVGTVLFSPGPIMASSDGFEIILKGRGAHGARPHEGVDAVTLAAQTILTLQSLIDRRLDAADPAVITIGRIEGGTRANILAEQVRLAGTVRTLSRENRERIQRLIEGALKGISTAYDASYELNYRKGHPVVYNHPQLAKAMQPTLLKALGEDHVGPLKPQMISEDFSYFCQEVPVFFFFLGVRPRGMKEMPPLHNPYYNPDEESLTVGIRTMCHLLLDCLELQSTLETHRP